MSTAANQIAARTVGADLIATSESTASTSYVALATNGPVVTCTTSASAIVASYANILASGGATAAWMSYSISGATTSAEVDNRAIQVGAASVGQRIGAVFFHSTILTPGTNVFTARYRITGAGTGTFADRRLLVLPM